MNYVTKAIDSARHSVELAEGGLVYRLSADGMVGMDGTYIHTRDERVAIQHALSRVKAAMDALRDARTVLDNVDLHFEE